MEKRDLYLDDINKLKTLIGFILKKDIHEIFAYKQHLTNEYYDKQLLEIDSIETWSNPELEDIQYLPEAMISEIIIFFLTRIETEFKSKKATPIALNPPALSPPIKTASLQVESKSCLAFIKRIAPFKS